MLVAGARLSFVVVELEGTVKRPVTKYDHKKREIKHELVEQPAGYMVYFPRGHVLRFATKEQLERYGLNRKPNIINMQGLNDPNSPIGKMLYAQDEDGRERAYADLEKQVINLATARTGVNLMPEQQAGFESEAA